LTMSYIEDVFSIHQLIAMVKRFYKDVKL
jgi:hypothetical protein